MLNDNLPQKIQTTDLSEQDMAKVNKYIEEGTPGFGKVSETTIFRPMDMYLSGSTYHQIADSACIKRVPLMYLSHRYKWYDAKMEYLTELQEHIKSRVVASKLASQDFLLLLNQAYQKKIGKQLKKYLATDDNTHTEEIDL